MEINVGNKKLGGKMQWRWNYFFLWFDDDVAEFIVSRK